MICIIVMGNVKVWRWWVVGVGVGGCFGMGVGLGLGLWWLVGMWDGFWFCGVVVGVFVYLWFWSWGGVCGKGSRFVLVFGIYFMRVVIVCVIFFRVIWGISCWCCCGGWLVVWVFVIWIVVMVLFLFLFVVLVFRVFSLRVLVMGFLYYGCLRVLILYGRDGWCMNEGW